MRTPSKAHLSVILVGAAVAFSLLGDMAIYTIVPIYYRDLGLIPIQVGILLSANRWIRIVTNHVAERLTCRLRPLGLMIGALLLGSILAAAYSRVPPFWLFLPARMLWGLCWSFLRHIGVMTTMRRSTSRDAGRLLGLFNGIARVGSVAGMFFGGLLFDAVGFSRTLLIFAAASLAGIPASVAALKGEERFSRSRDVAGLKPSTVRRAAALLFCGFTVGCVGPGIITSTLGYILSERVGAGIDLGVLFVGVATINGLVLATRHIANTAAAPVIGSVLDRMGRYRGGLLFSILGGVMLCGLAALSRYTAALLLLTVLFFVCSVGLYLALTAEAGRRGSRAYASFATASDIGSALGPVIGWTIFEFIGSPLIIFLAGGALYAAAAVLSKRAFRRG